VPGLPAAAKHATDNGHRVREYCVHKYCVPALKKGSVAALYFSIRIFQSGFSNPDPEACTDA
jgi:hypothetical protein